MRTLVVGDVHGCAGELEELLALAKADRVVFVGDLFTKGPDPVGVWNLAREHESVLGNHEARLLRVAGGRPSRDVAARECVRLLDAGAPGWLVWVGRLPRTLQVKGFVVVHAGLHPSGDLTQTDDKWMVSMRHFPFRDYSAPFWHDHYVGSKPVIFGHHAARGLVRIYKDERPYLLGLDTGCVYGGQLTGYLIEEDRLLQVGAREVYEEPLVP